MFKRLVKNETLTGQQAIERIEAEAKIDLPFASLEVSKAMERMMEQITNPGVSKARIDASVEEFHVANERLNAVYNVVSFFVSLDDQSHYGSAEPRK